MTRQAAKAAGATQSAKATQSASSAHSRQTVYVGMSGGVDSSLSAALLVEQGYHVVGAYMKNWSRDLPGMHCPWAEDLADAKRVAVRLGIDFEVLDFEAEYKEKVVDYMLAEFAAGRTPNPDIMCNQEVKFKLFYEVARARGADLIATGHYARARGGELLRAADANKDQTYFLYRVSSEALAHTLFPVGDLLKPQVKEMAAARGLANAYKKESMGICFVGEVGMEDFLRQYFPEQPGPVVDADSGQAVGTHHGAIFYTIGQRHGLDLSDASGLPYYIVRKDMAANTVYVSRRLDHEELWVRQLELADTFWRATPPAAVLVRLRHRGELVPAQIEVNGSRAWLRFAEEVKRPASGQSAVVYDGEVCVGGGVVL